MIRDSLSVVRGFFAGTTADCDVRGEGSGSVPSLTDLRRSRGRDFSILS